MIEVYATSQKPRKAEQLFTRLKNLQNLNVFPDATTLRLMASMYKENNNPRKASAILAEITKMQPESQQSPLEPTGDRTMTTFTPSTLDRDEASRTNVQREGQSASTISTGSEDLVVSESSKLKLLQAEIAFNESIQNPNTNKSQAYNYLLSVYTKHSQHRKAQELVRTMVADGIPKTVVTYNLILEQYAKENSLSGVQGITRKMAEEGVEPNGMYVEVIH